jgi:ornithine carbamoyltransferase
MQNDMKTKTKTKDFIDLRDYTREDIEGILALAGKIKSREMDVSDTLSRKTFGLLFNAPSTRTRLSFQAGVRHMGGHGEYLTPDRLQLVNNESFADTARVMSKFLDGLIIRMYDMDRYGEAREAMKILCQEASIPIINALDDKDHPCQVMADLLTLKEIYGEEFKRKKMVFTWGYSSWQQSPGIPHSMMSATSILGMDVVFANPEGFDLEEDYIDFARQTVARSGGSITFSNDLMEASEGADIIYVKSWKAWRMPTEKEFEVRHKLKDDWCVTEAHFERANPGALFMNCLPIVRGEQATAEVVDSPRSVIYHEAENRLHAQKAVLQMLFDK